MRTYIRGILLPGFCNKIPVTELPLIYVCKRKHDLSIVVINLFSIEEMRRYCIMGRGRKSRINQSERRAIPSRGKSERGMPMTYFFTPNREVKKYPYLNKPLNL